MIKLKNKIRCKKCKLLYLKRHKCQKSKITSENFDEGLTQVAKEGEFKPGEISQCPACFCMTYTGKFGECLKCHHLKDNCNINVSEVSKSQQTKPTNLQSDGLSEVHDDDSFRDAMDKTAGTNNPQNKMTQQTETDKITRELIEREKTLHLCGITTLTESMLERNLRKAISLAIKQEREKLIKEIEEDIEFFEKAINGADINIQPVVGFIQFFIKQKQAKLKELLGRKDE